MNISSVASCGRVDSSSSTRARSSLESPYFDKALPGGDRCIQKAAIISYTNLKIDQDPKTKDITINVEITPFFAAQNFFIELTGKNTSAGVDWEQNTKQV